MPHVLWSRSEASLDQSRRLSPLFTTTSYRGILGISVISGAEINLPPSRVTAGAGSCGTCLVAGNSFGPSCSNTRPIPRFGDFFKEDLCTFLKSCRRRALPSSQTSGSYYGLFFLICSWSQRLMPLAYSNLTD